MLSDGEEEQSEVARKRREIGEEGNDISKVKNYQQQQYWV